MRAGQAVRARGLVSALFVALVGLGIAATALAWANERDDAGQRDQDAADAAAAVLAQQFSSTIGSLRGADGLAADGEVTHEEFAAFAADILPGSLSTALAHERVVDDDQRTDFEAETGLRIVDTDGAGGFVTSSARDRHLVVVQIHPENESTLPLLGFDIASDAIRLAAAERSEETGVPALSDPITLANSSLPGVFAIDAITATTGETIGFVSTGVPVDDLVALSTRGRLTHVRITLVLDGTTLAGTSTSGARSSFVVGGKEFTVIADDPEGVRPALIWVIGLGTVALAGGFAASSRRDRRLTESLGQALTHSDAVGRAHARSAARSRAVLELGEWLASSAEPDDVVAELLRHAADVMGADAVVVGVRSPTELATMIVRRSDAADAADGVDGAGGEQRRLEPGGALDDAVLGGSLRTSTAPCQLCVPLVFHGGTTVGVLGFEWRTPQDFDADDIASATIIGELASHSLERAVITDTVQGAAGRLSELASGLAAAATAQQVIRAVEVLVPPILGAAGAVVTLLAESEPTGGEHPLFVEDVAGASPADWITEVPPGTSSLASLPVRGEAGTVIAELSIRWRQPLTFGPTVRSVLLTIGDLIGQTLTRAGLYDIEHELIEELQLILLPTMPPVEGLELAFRYEPAISVVGIGGDWYDTALIGPGRLVAVIGDVNGHGAEAVAVMAQLQAVMSHLLRNDTPPADVLQQASRMLAERNRYATAQIVEIDVNAGTLVLVNAGHPYPLLRRADGTVEQLREGRRSLLGVEGAAADGMRCTFEPGDELLLYTDGLIERRERSIDDHIDRLATIWGQVTDRRLGGAQTLDGLLSAARADAAAGMALDDDVAAVLIRRVVPPGPA